MTPSQATTGTPSSRREKRIACCSRRPDPAGGVVGEGAPARRLGVQHVHHDQREAALAHVAQRLHEPAVEQRRERDHERARRERGPRQAAEDGAAGEPGVGLQQRVDDPVELAAAEGRGQPVRAAPLVGDHADPVAGGQVGPGGAGRAAQPQVERGLAGLADVRGRVHQQHHVLGALGRERVHLEAAEAGGGRPVDRPLPVAGDVLADAGELGAVAGHPGPVLAQPVRQLADRTTSVRCTAGDG